MSTLTALARALAVAEGRAQPIATVRHLHVHDHPLILIPLAMAGEANAPLAALVGTDPARPRLLAVAQPRNRDDRFAFAAELAGVLVPYLDSFTDRTEDVPVDRGKDVRQRYVDAPQIWVPNPGGIDFLRLFGRSTRFRTVDGENPVPAAVPLLGRWLTFFTNTAEVPGSSLLVNAVQALGLHWATGQSGAEDAQFGAQLAWIESGAAAAREAENGPVAGPATDPDFDNRVLAPLIERSAPELPDVLRDLLLPTWERMWRTLTLLRRLPAGERVRLRWDTDRDAFTAFTQHLAEGGPPQPRRDGAVAAAARLQRLENAATRYAVQRAFDDPLVLAEYRLTGTAFAGVVTLAKADRIDDSGKRPVLRPRIMVHTTEPVRMEPGTSLTSPTRPSQKARVVSVTPAAPEGHDVLLELSGGMGRKLVAEPGSVPAVGEHLILTTLSEAYRPSGVLPDPAETPWTHGGPPTPTDQTPTPQPAPTSAPAPAAAPASAPAPASDPASDPASAPAPDAAPDADPALATAADAEPEASRHADHRT
ncbi:hypothetical protein FHR83_006535 [Actinoplanes campanulatus]|uniref:Uncharacterized protein n=2 Tax=Actinoplanes campanulatus TaxID=113559 RepID=A0A7W5AM57_9ACTN|nr:hypothetical protein [Actinoplanes campanulatus]MBB3098836.1 hypothetical protein [Actinoplanes campanulatus]GGN36788.1 hypothetical protein GCM10010109_62100 [Actinoplanes campanulatus]